MGLIVKVVQYLNSDGFLIPIFRILKYDSLVVRKTLFPAF